MEHLRHSPSFFVRGAGVSNNQASEECESDDSNEFKTGAVAESQLRIVNQPYFDEQRNIWVASLNENETRELQATIIQMLCEGNYQALRQINFRGLKLADIDFRKLNVNFSRLDLQDADFSKSNLSDCSFRECDLTRAKFTGAITSLQTIFDGADLRHARLDLSFLKKINLTQAIIDETTQISTEYLKSMLSTPPARDLNLNHINNPSGSILFGIHSISHIGKKIELMNKVAEEILRHPEVETILNELHAPLIDVLLEREDSNFYSDSSRNDNEFTRKLSYLLVERSIKGNVLSLERISLTFSEVLLSYIEEKINSQERNKWASEYNPNLQVLLYKMNLSANERIRNWALCVKSSVLNLDFLRDFVNQHMEYNGLRLDDPEDVRNTLFFTSEKIRIVLDGEYCAFWILKENKASQLLAPSMGNIYVYQLNSEGKYELGRVEDLMDVVEPWKLLRDALGRGFSEKRALKMWEHTFPTDLKDPLNDAFSQEVVKIIMKARASKISRTKLTGNQGPLTKILLPLIEKEEVFLGYLNKFYEIYELRKSSNKIKSVAAVSKAAELAHLASSHHTSLEDDSVQIFRQCAVKFLQEAIKLGIDELIPKKIINDWILILEGGKNENNIPVFQCTAVLFIKMLDQLKKLGLTNQEIEDIVKELIPVAWR